MGWQMVSSKTYAFFAVVFLFIRPYPVWANEKWKDRLLLEGPKGWDALAGFGLKGSLVRTKNVPPHFPNAKKFDQIRIQSDFIIKDSLVMIQTNYQKILGDKIFQERKTVAGINSEYHFVLEKKDPGNATGEIFYLLRKFGKARKESLSLARLRYIQGSWPFLGRPFEYWLKWPAFSILELGPVRQNSRQLVRLKAKHEPVDKKTDWGDAFQATLLFDPEKFWCIQEYQVDFQGLIE